MKKIQSKRREGENDETNIGETCCVLQLVRQVSSNRRDQPRVSRLCPTPRDLLGFIWMSSLIGDKTE